MKIKLRIIRRKRKMTKVMHWILSNPDKFFLICGVGAERMTDEKFEEMWRFLRNEEFEVLFAVLMVVHHEKIGIDIE